MGREATTMGSSLRISTRNPTHRVSAATMTSLTQFLQFLQRQDVSEIVFQAGSQPAMAAGGRYVALSQTQLTPQHMVSLVRATPLAGPLPAADGTEHRETVQVDGRAYAVVLRRVGERTQLRFSNAKADGAASTAASAAAPVRAATQSQPMQKAAPKEPQRAAPTARTEQEARAKEVTAPASVKSNVTMAGPAEPMGEPDPELCRILAQAREQRASDVHVMAGRPIAIRRAGSLRSEGPPLSAERVEGMLLSVMQGMRREQLERAGYSDFAVRLPSAGPFRVNVGRQATGLKGAFRMVSEQIPTIEQLGMPPELTKVTMYHQGLAVVSGPNGHGKTTTLSALVGLINENKAHHIITVEDPVEVQYPAAKAVISQREVGVHTASFARALKGALREDPDVIVIGELRDLETVEIALEAAETGHLVITTMSTRSGAKTIDRLIDMFPPDEQSQVRATLAVALKIIVSQRLLPSVSGDRLVAAAELITGNIMLGNLIRDNKLIQLPSLMQRGRNIGMIRLDESLRDLVGDGKITEDVAMVNAENPAELKRMLAQLNHAASGAALAADSPVAGSGKEQKTGRDLRRTLGGKLSKKRE